MPLLKYHCRCEYFDNFESAVTLPPTAYVVRVINSLYINVYIYNSVPAFVNIYIYLQISLSPYHDFIYAKELFIKV